MNYFLIGDKVNIPKHKVVGTIIDKLYRSDDEELMLKIEPSVRDSRSAYDKTCYPTEVSWVKYSTVRSMKPIDIYRNRTTYPEPEEIISLNIPKLLKEKGIIEGSEVKVIDNYLLERMISYPSHYRLFNTITLSELFKKGNPILTGERVKMDNGEIAVQCRFKNSDRYYIYMSCLQVVKKMNIFRRFLRLFGFIKKIRNVPKGLWPLLIYSIVTLILCIVALVTKIIH